MAIRYFISRYGIENYRVVRPNGRRKDKSCVYPWEA